MGNQEGMFAEQGKQAQSESRHNTDPREQRFAPEPHQGEAEHAYGEYEEGYEGYRGPSSETYRGYERNIDPGQLQQGGGKIQPQRKSPGVGLRALGVVLLVVFIGIGLSFLFGWQFSKDKPIALNAVTSTRSFVVSNSPVLAVKSTNSDIMVHRGDVGKIVVNARTSKPDKGNSVPVSYSQDGSTLTVQVNGASPSFFNTSTRLDITVPDTTNVQIEENGGDVSINNFNGQISTNSVHGDIQLGNVEGKADLVTNGGGDIRVIHFKGQMSAKIQYGDIAFKDSTLSGQSHLEAASGDVSFGGSLNPSGTYSMSTSSGDINVSLPQDAAVQITHSTSGDYHNKFDSDTLGNSPRASLQLISKSGGDITVGKQ
ncbi:hypothetical protein EPA93_36740 [Ktedonosporobacter rubrisoli]|uniref:DUF4097 domain-containing protein n=1 Tax=Ktedonosporobacter rubrisoli TaxID=2509675 RepID=A0A4P6K0R8_KTERU|nr:DUF4097 family beta strand repeat-containing protein [Ktedonosporobacter rubrisoli]QBD81230.1 hypothetical protein EPA93_36740 [Ktedonosporobacter rubrisoli]